MKYGFKKWVIDNEERIRRAEERGKLPYFLQENKKVFENILGNDVAFNRYRKEYPFRLSKELDFWNEDNVKELENEIKKIFSDIDGVEKLDLSTFVGGDSYGTTTFNWK